MQILFITNPLAPIREIHFSKKKFIIGLGAITFICIGMNWFIASQVNQARTYLISLDQVNSQKHQVRLLSESDYEGKLYELQVQLQEMQKKIEKLNIINEGLQKEKKVPKNSGHLNSNQGGPLNLHHLSDLSREPYQLRLSLSMQKSKTLHMQLDQLERTFANNKAILKSAPMVFPLPFRVKPTSGSGYRIDPILGRTAWHDGNDYPAPYGTQILAAASGVVITSGWSGDYGNMVEVRHPNGKITRYAHAQDLMVRVGQRVQQSQVIARVGSSGRSTGPHLHYQEL